MSKLAEADLYVKKAEKCMKTSFLKWSTDTEGAIANYSKAAECYKDGKDFNNSIIMYKKVADMHQQTDSLFYCAKALEEAANIYNILKDRKNMVALILSAGEKLRINGSSDTACQLLKRTAKSLEEDEPREAAKLYFLAADAAQDKDCLRDAGDYAGLAAKLFVRMKDNDDALKALRLKSELFSRAGVYHEAGKAVVCQVLIHLYNNDFVSAAKVYGSCVEEQSGFSGSEDASPINQLLNACDQREYEEAKRILKGPTFAYLENDFVKLARDIKFPECISKKGDNNNQTGDDKMEVIEDIN